MPGAQARVAPGACITQHNSFLAFSVHRIFWLSVSTLIFFPDVNQWGITSTLCRGIYSLNKYPEGPQWVPGTSLRKAEVKGTPCSQFFYISPESISS